jgi:hypothetical protein
MLAVLLKLKAKLSKFKILMIRRRLTADHLRNVMRI